MNYTVVPITMSGINWKVLLDGTKERLGRHVARPLDQNKIPTDSFYGFLGFLSALENPDAQPMKAIRENDLLTDHLFFSFALNVEDWMILPIIRAFDLCAVMAEERCYLLLSGTLSEWRRALIRGCSDSVLPFIRMFANQLFAFFERAGLRDIWVNFSKQGLSDSSFKLLEVKR